METLFHSPQQSSRREVLGKAIKFASKGEGGKLILGGTIFGAICGTLFGVGRGLLAAKIPGEKHELRRTSRKISRRALLGDAMVGAGSGAIAGGLVAYDYSHK